MELRRKRGVATIIWFPLKDVSGNLVTDVTGVTPQYASLTEDSTTSPYDPWKLVNTAGGVASISQGSIYWSSLSATEMANDYVYFVASPTTGSAKRFDCIINCTSVASVTRVSTVDQVMDLRSTSFAELTGVPAASSTIMQRIGWLFILARNLITQSSATQVVWDDNQTATVSTAAISDSGTLFQRGEWS